MRKAKKAVRKKNLSVKALRKIIGRTQADFGALIGASKEAVISWENGRNPLSGRFLWLIYQTTGADIMEMANGNGIVLNLEHKPYTKDDFESWKRTYSDGYARAYRERYESTGGPLQEPFLNELLLAAARPGPSRIRDQFLGVLGSFIQWRIRTIKDFRLEKRIAEVRAERARREQREEPLLGGGANPRATAAGGSV
jgi:transcriptional regulator with XRE-family HTH domain